ncbi:MAG TPA: TonB-dependent receptor [Bacteroidia bacterium]|nr:TonB-dependent receptor [Bacteroidia bacterium]
MKNKFPLFFLLLLIPCLLPAQKVRYSISGTVFEKSSLEKLPGVTVVNLKTKSGTATNNYGFYSLTLSPDSVKLQYSFVGYEPVVREFVLTKDTVLDIELLTKELATVTIIDESEKVSENTQMSQVSIPVAQIKEIPALLGEKDVLKVVQLMPGVQKGQEGSSGFYVRGGGADQNLIILDDAVVYNAFHLFGFFSLFNGDALKSVELTKGGFPARYGGRLSSVLEMQMRDGDKEKYRVEAGIGLISSRATVEGPIKKGKSSFLVSGRRTYIDLLMRPLMKGPTKAGYFFYDFTGKINYQYNAKNSFYLSGYFGRDKFYSKLKEGLYQSEASLGWGNATGTLRWNHIWGDKLFSNTSLIVTDYNLKIKVDEFYQTDSFQLVYSSGIRDLSLKYDFDFSPLPEHFIRFGFVSTYHSFFPSALVVSGFGDGVDVKARKIEAWQSGLYVEDDWLITPRLKANIGFRLSYFAVQRKNYFRPEPRIAVRYRLRDNLSVKACWTVMNQYLHLLSNTGVGLPTDLWVPATKKVAPQQGWQAAAGVAKDFPEHNFALTVEGYYKHSRDVLGYREGASFFLIGDLGSGGEPINWEDEVTPGQSWSYGAEILLQRKAGKLTGWVGYTLSWTQMQFDEINFGEKYYARYDRRHDISIVAIYKATERITLSATWVYGTGNAITLPQAEYLVSEHDPTGQQASNFQFWDFRSDFGKKNDFRMAAYHRLDAGIQFHRKKKRFEQTFEFSVYNVYNRKNPFYYYVGYDNAGNRKLRQVSLFPIIPSVSWNWKF